MGRANGGIGIVLFHFKSINNSWKLYIWMLQSAKIGPLPRSTLDGSRIDLLRNNGASFSMFNSGPTPKARLFKVRFKFELVRKA